MSKIDTGSLPLTAESQGQENPGDPEEVQFLLLLIWS